MGMLSEIRLLRDRLQMTQREIAELLGVTVNTFAQWEQGDNTPKWLAPHLEMLATQRGVGSPLSGTRYVAKDPLHQEILEKLNQKVAPDDFEACAVDLIAESGIDVVLISGGSDDGFDGAVTSPGSEPSPLVVTTSTDALRNFKRNLTKASSHTNSRIAYLATTRNIRPNTRRSIADFARLKGFRLGNIFDQSWFASRLYREPEWCEKLLGVCGQPSALCAIPEIRRPIGGDTVVGRDEELGVLRDHERDCLVVGAPGSGKTFVLLDLVQRHGALFLYSQNVEEIANAMRKQKPDIVLVDDVHIHNDRLEAIVNVRRRIGGDFRIIASSWPISNVIGGVKVTLQLQEDDVIALEPLSSSSILEIIETFGILGPPSLLAMIRQQAAGMPGLAVTFCDLLRNSRINLRHIASGEALLNQLMPQLVKNVSRDIQQLLAPYAVGGNRGMDVPEIVNHLATDKAAMMRNLTDLSDAGVVFPDPFNDHIVVRPFALAVALVRNGFFGRVPDHDGYLQLFNQSPEKAESLRVLIGVHAFGGRIPYIEGLLKEHGDTMNLLDFASIGDAEADFVIREFPDRILSTARGFLRTNPDRSLPILFDYVIKLPTNFEGNFSQMKDVVDSWLSELPPKHPEVIKRRSILIESTIDWASQHSVNDPIVARLINYALVKAFEGRWMGNTLSAIETEIIVYEVVPDVNETDLLRKHWRNVGRLLFESANVSGNWIETIDLIRQWCFVLVKHHVDHPTREARTRFATLVRNDLAAYCKSNPGLLTEITRFDDTLKGSTSVTIDRDFQTLFAKEDRERLEIDRKLINGEIEAMCERCIQNGPEDTAKFLTYVEGEARKAGIRYPRRTFQLCMKIADRVEDPFAWLSVFLREKCPGDLINPLLNKSATTKKRDTIELVSQFNDDGSYNQELLEISMTDVEAFRRNADSLNHFISTYPDVLDIAMLRSRLDEDVLEELLASSNPIVAYVAALAFYKTEEKPPAKHVEMWRSVIVEGIPIQGPDPANEHYLEEIFADDHQLAVVWLARYLGPYDIIHRFSFDQLANKVIRLLTATERIAVIRSIEVKNVPSDTIIELVGSDVDVYRVWLESDTNTHEQLTPLTNPETDHWRVLALEALNHGFRPTDIAQHASKPDYFTWIGSELDKWKQRRVSFERFAEDRDHRIVRLVELILEILDKTIQERAQLSYIRP